MQGSAHWFRRLLVAAVCWCSTCFGTALGGERNSSFAAALESIRSEELKGHVDYLADDALEGREAGSRGSREAGDYLAGKLAELGLGGAGVDGGFFQPFDPNFRNVLGLVRGADPDLKQEFLVVGAHYDHLGYGTKQNSRGHVGQIHNGADDNASGTSALLELAEAFTMLPQPPRRSILFALWDAEEKGLVGSKYWTDHPTLPLERVAVLLNVDMVGRLRDDRLLVYGTRTGYGWRRLISGSNEDPGLQLDFTWDLNANGDHWPFFGRGIPVLMMHTGLHEDYHQPSDDAPLINVDGMRRVARFLFALSYDLAERDALPHSRDAAHHENESTHREGLGGKPDRLERLGITWRADDAEPRAIVLTQVVSGSPADRAGLKIGDYVYQVAGRDFADEAEFAELARTLPAPLTLLVERDGRLRTVEIHLESESLRRAA